jgi:hypothetical protein
MGEDSFCPFLSPNWHPSQLDKRPLPENPKKIHMILTTEPLPFLLLNWSPSELVK